jgi:hypothetical protein
MILNIFFSIKLIRQSRGGQKNFPERDKLPKVLPKNTIFQNPGGAAALPGTLCIRHFRWIQHNATHTQAGMGKKESNYFYRLLIFYSLIVFGVKAASLTALVNGGEYRQH